MIECNGDWCVAGDCDAHQKLREADAKIKSLESRLRRAEEIVRLAQRGKCRNDSDGTMSEALRAYGLEGGE